MWRPSAYNSSAVIAEVGKRTNCKFRKNTSRSKVASRRPTTLIDWNWPILFTPPSFRIWERSIRPIRGSFILPAKGTTAHFHSFKDQELLAATVKVTAERIAKILQAYPVRNIGGRVQYL